MKILITGGHLTPALAVIDKLLNSDKKNRVRIIFAGRKYISGCSNESLEFKEINKRKIPFLNLQAGRLTRLLTLRSFINLLCTPVGFLQSYLIIRNEKPDIILTFGGYLGLPIAVGGWLNKISIYIHEQTIKPGITNRSIAHLSKRIFIAFESTKQYFPAQKTIVTGNPIREKIFKVLSKPIHITKNKPCIYITGGSLGSHSINLMIEKILNLLLKKYIIIHQTGDVMEYGDFQRLNTIRNKLPPDLRQNYFLRKHFLDDETGYIYSQTDLLIGRSGANTFFELIALRIPALFVPLPWSAGNEQMEHAKIFKKFGTGEIFEQSDNVEKLAHLIDLMMNKIEYYRRNFKNLSFLYKENAASTIIDELFK